MWFWCKWLVVFQKSCAIYFALVIGKRTHLPNHCQHWVFFHLSDKTSSFCIFTLLVKCDFFFSWRAFVFFLFSLCMHVYVVLVLTGTFSIANDSHTCLQWEFWGTQLKYLGKEKKCNFKGQNQDLENVILKQGLSSFQPSSVLLNSWVSQDGPQ